MLYINLFYEYFKIGVLSFGGGYATIPFLHHLSQVYNWFSPNDLEKMIAISSITPGPVGINMATFSGLQTGGFIGAIIATSAIILPALFIVLIVSKFLIKFNENIIVKAIIYGLKPAACGLLAAVTIDLIKTNLTSSYAIGLFLALLSISLLKKKDPMFYLVTSGLIGLIFKLTHLI